MTVKPLPPSLREVAARSADGGGVPFCERRSPSHGYRRDSPLIEGAKSLYRYRNGMKNRNLFCNIFLFPPCYFETDGV